MNNILDSSFKNQIKMAIRGETSSLNSEENELQEEESEEN